MWNTNWTAAQNRCKDTQTTTLLDKRSQCHTCSLKDYYSDILDRAFGMRCVPYNWCENKPCMCAVGALITLTLYFCLNTAQYIHIVEYSECFITDARVRGSVVFVHTGIRRSKQLVLTEELFTDGVVNNNKTLFFIKLMQYKDTAQQAFNYFIIYLLFTW